MRVSMLGFFRPGNTGHPGAKFARFCGDRSGSYAIVTAVLFPVLIGFVAFGTDVGVWFLKHQSLQTAADSAALSAANALESGNSDIALVAQAVSGKYGFVAGTNGTTVTVNKPPKSGSYQDSSNAIEVILKTAQPRYFSSIFNNQPLTIAARAVAREGSPGGGCVLSLDRTASGAATLQGSASVNLTNCALYDDSNSSSALTTGGTGSIQALATYVVGGVSSTANIATTQGVITDAAVVGDPYAKESPPSVPGPCQHFNPNDSILPNTLYCNIKVGANQTVTLSPGIYYIDVGSGGSFKVDGQGTVTGTGVTLVLTSSTGSWPNNANPVSISGGATVSITAPTSGPTAGIALFADRSMPLGTPLSIAGGASQYFGGAVYAPTAAVSYAGGSSSGTGCTQIIGDTVNFVGNSSLTVDCSGAGTKNLGVSVSELIE